MTVVFLSLGSNINREKNITSALNALSKLFGEIQVSTVYESEAVGFEGSNFFNLIVGIESDYSLRELSSLLKRLEDEHGRDRSGPKFGARTLDIDIVLYGDLVGIHSGIELPRPEMYRNAFVLKPLADLVPEKLDPKTQQTFLLLWQQAAIDQKLWPVSLSS